MSKYIQLLRVPFSDPNLNYLQKTGAVSIDSQGVFTTSHQWLSGVNPWAFHNNLWFGKSMEHAKISRRIETAVYQAIQAKLPYLVLEETDYEALLQSIREPIVDPNLLPCPASLARCVLPILEEIESASDEPPKLPEEEKQEEQEEGEE